MDAHQQDFLTEVLNIGMGKAGDVLSRLVNTKVYLTVPELNICRAEELPEHLDYLGTSDILSVTQGFSGILSGEAIMVMSNYSGMLLRQKVIEHAFENNDPELSKQEILIEVGNIVINNLVGSWSKIFYDHFKFQVPEYREARITELVYDHLDKTKFNNMEMFAIWGNTHFEVKEFFILGSVFILFDRHSIEKLVGSIESSQISGG